MSDCGMTNCLPNQQSMVEWLHGMGNMYHILQLQDYTLLAQKPAFQFTTMWMVYGCTVETAHLAPYVTVIM